jgi:hypothetical protein
MGELTIRWTSAEQSGDENDFDIDKFEGAPEPAGPEEDTEHD